MTGTPVANRPYDLWSQVYFLDQGNSLGNSFSEFKDMADLDTGDDTEVSSDAPASVSAVKIGSKEYANNLSHILEDIKAFTIRDTKESSGLKLPGKSYEQHYVELENSQLTIYDKYKFELRSEIVVEDEIVLDEAEAILKRLLRLVQIASNPMLIDESYDEEPAKFKVLKSLLDSITSSGSEVIVWSSFIKNIEWLREKFSYLDPAFCHGSLSSELREAQINNFKKNEQCKVLFATQGSAKEGLTLTNANHVIFYDRSFSLDDYLQAQDRIHRISQEKDCIVHNLIAKNTIDIWIEALLHAKTKAAQLVQGDITEESFLQSFNFDLKEMLESILN